MPPPIPRRRAPGADRGASAAEYAGLIVLAALVFAALAALFGPRIPRDVERALCTILHTGRCPAVALPPAPVPAPQPTTAQARCVRDQRISYVEAQGYARPRIVGGRAGMRWTTTTRVVSHGPGRPPTYEVTVQSWKEAAVEAGLKGGRLPVDALAYLGVNSTQGNTYAFATREQAEAFRRTVPRYFVGGTAYDATKAAAGPVGQALGLLDKVTGGHVKKWAQGDPPKPQQAYRELGPTAGAELKADIPLGDGGRLSAGVKGRFWRLYGVATNHTNGEKTYYLRQNNEIQPTVTLNLAGYAAAWKGLTGHDLQAAIAKAVVARTGRAVRIPPTVARWVIGHGSAGLTLKWKPNTQYRVTYDKDGDMTRVTKVDDTILTWYGQGGLKGGKLGGHDGSPDRNGRGRHRKPRDPAIADPRVQGTFGLASTRTTETSTVDTRDPEVRRMARGALGRLLLQESIDPVTPPGDDALEAAFRDRGTRTRLEYRNDVNGGKAEGRAYGVKGLVGLELGGEDEHDRLSSASYWDRSTGTWKPWTECR